MKYISFLLIALSFFSCKNETTTSEDKDDISAISTKGITDFKVLDSKHLTKADIWKTLDAQLSDFTEDSYNAVKHLILDQSITIIQLNIADNKLSYEWLVKFYLYRIRKFDRENGLSLNSVIALNPNIIEEAKQKDIGLKNKALKHPIYGMPILLKDNINASGMPTTAGAVALKDNMVEDAFIVNQLKKNGALILGKANLSEWAYFFCGDCPSGYSAIGGQTLNPYGRKTIDTGGSSSGSGVSVTANFCAAAIGSETAGSILSPASQNSAVGLKPTIGLVSRSGIVPISSTLDTAGPITKNVIDNAIVLSAIFGFDDKDSKSINPKWSHHYYTSLTYKSLKGKRFGALKPLLKDSLYTRAIEDLKSKGAIVVEVEPQDIKLPNFIRLLNLDMQKDLPAYFESYANKNLELKTVDDVMAFNLKDSINTMPYGQALFKGIVADSSSEEAFQKIKDTLKTNGRQFFDTPMDKQNLDAILSINNYHAAFAAVAEYPALTVPMGYEKNGAPKGLTFIGKPLSEKQLLGWAFHYEQASKRRVSPKNYN